MRLKHLVTSVAALAAAGTAQAFGEAPTPEMNLIPSWGDITLVYGPGTDAAMDTPEAMEKMVRHWKGRGFTGVYLRSDLDQFPPGEVIRHHHRNHGSPGLALYWQIVDEIMVHADPHKTIRAAADKLGYDYWLSHPHIYSEGAPADVGVEGLGRMVPWSYMMKYHRDHPEVITIDRQGNKQWMVPEYAYPGMRANKAAEFGHMAKTYRPKGIIASMRSETSQLIPPPDHADQYGFNQPVVDDMKRLYNVDIMTDPRFDWKSPSFRSDDERVQKWRDLRGTYITQLYREIRAAIRQANPEVQFAVGISGEFVGPLMGNARLEWRKWIDEGIVDVLIMPMTFEATLDPDSDKKGYLTNTRTGKGTVSIETVKAYVKQSKNPQIKVISTGAPSYFYPSPPAGADGWQCDAWYDSYNLAIYQRWEQWKKDIADLGSIHFFKQDFDGFEPNATGAAGGIGDGRHHPELRSTPGMWSRVGDGSDAKPFIQSDVRRGGKGNAVALTGKEIMAVHYSSPDRSLLTGQMDTAIVNGKALLTFHVYREGDANTFTAIFTGNAQYERDVALRIAKSGQVSYKNGGSWVETKTAVPIQQWYPLAIEVDVNTLKYSARAGEDQVQLCSDVPIAHAEDRFVTQHGNETVKFSVPSYRIFNTLIFSPEEGAKQPVYLDDVLVQWKPTMHYSAPGKRVHLAQNFEDVAYASSDPGTGLAVEADEQVRKPFFVERTTSFGEGVHCLRANGGGRVVSALDQDLTASRAGDIITVDFDLFIRSDKDFPYMIPDLTTRSPHRVKIGLEGASPDQPFVQISAGDGVWQIWDGSNLTNTGSVIHYDVWNHVQLVVDTRAKTYRAIVQPVGQMPAVVGKGAVGSAVRPNEKLRFFIAPSDTKDHITCYDNIKITTN